MSSFMKGIQKKVSSHILYALNKGGHTALFPIGVALLILLPFIQACQTGKGQSSQSFLDSSYYSAKAYYDSISFHKQSVLSSPETKKVQKGLDHFYNQDRKSTRLNSSHVAISYAVFCLKKKKNTRS